MTAFRLFALLPLLGASACFPLGGSYVPILDGPAMPRFQADLQACQSLASNQDHLDQEALGAAAAGGLLAAAIADHEGDVTAAEGLIAGALFGYVSALFETADDREKIIVTCMQGRGHRVVG